MFRRTDPEPPGAAARGLFHVLADPPASTDRRRLWRWYGRDDDYGARHANGITMTQGNDNSVTAKTANGELTERARRKGTRFVFIDTEATGLDHTRHELTEVSWIVRFEDGSHLERQFFPEHTVDGAHPDALELTHYSERIAPQPRTPASVWLTQFLEDATDAILVGAVPDFDAQHLHRMCRKLQLEPTWDHHLLDVETLALPLIAPGPEAPRSLAKTCAALGVPHDKDQAHGALYDARQAMAVFDKIWDQLAQIRAANAPLPAPVPRSSTENQDEATSAASDTSPADD